MVEIFIIAVVAFTVFATLGFVMDAFTKKNIHNNSIYQDENMTVTFEKKVTRN